MMLCHFRHLYYFQKQKHRHHLLNYLKHQRLRYYLAKEMCLVYSRCLPHHLLFRHHRQIRHFYPFCPLRLMFPHRLHHQL